MRLATARCSFFRAGGDLVGETFHPIFMGAPQGGTPPTFGVGFAGVHRAPAGNCLAARLGDDRFPAARGRERHTVVEAIFHEYMGANVGSRQRAGE